jgi:hypothetical protein
MDPRAATCNVGISLGRDVRLVDDFSPFRMIARDEIREVGRAVGSDHRAHVPHALNERPIGGDDADLPSAHGRLRPLIAL